VHLDRSVAQRALEGLLSGAIAYGWPDPPVSDDIAPEELEDWEGLVGSAMDT
jgi:hypothetical protein